ncbi:MAG: acyl-CoA dehydrogenase [Alphaproteobacteria bacterium]|nr:acyl-CoA dehydrogenase [Alphaproteobacteria bacterium]HCP01121.1 acyl-CoA dehydrogenase [Rhodospirillaceae bacterium]
MALDKKTRTQLLETIRRYVRERLVPREAEVAENDAVPEDIITEMREMGLFGLSIPVAYGGLGLSVSDEVRVVHELGWTSPAFRSVFGTNVGIGSQGIVIDGTDEQKTHWLPKLASGDIIASFALTEPEAGSDAGALRTSARRDGGEYVLNGTKRYITNAPHAGIFTVMARTNPDEPGARGVSAFIVERKTPGLSVGPHDKKMGQQGAHTADVVFDDCRVPASNLIGGVEGRGFKTAMKVLDRGRLHMGAIATGIAERLIEECVQYACERQQFGKPIGEFQLIQAMLADSRTEAYAGRTMVEDAGRRFDAGENIVTEAACCKLYCTEMVGRVADRAVQIFGGAGYMAEYPIERFYRDVRLLRIYEGTSQIQQIVIARNMLRAAASS